MSKLSDFYRKAEADPAIKADLETAVIAGTIEAARKHGITLESADFSEMDEAELETIAAGRRPLMYNSWKRTIISPASSDKHPVQSSNPVINT